MREKSLKDISWLVDEPTYRADSALSYSTLASYERNGRFSSLPTLFDKVETPSLTFGSMVDTLITGSEEEFQQQFVVIDNPGLSESLLEITQKLYSLHKEDGKKFDELDDEELATIGKECNYYAGDKYKNYRVKQIRENCKPYYNTLCIAEGKRVVTPQDVEDARRCVQALKICERTAFYFEDNDPFDDSIERLYQLKFKRFLEGIEYRCMADEIIIDYNKKTIQPIDLKTSSHNEWEFPKSFQQWLYVIQARLYWRLIKETIKDDPYFHDFKVLPYKFIVVNRKNCKPMVWDFPYTETYGEIKITTPAGYIITWRDPFVIGKELKRYLDENPELPFDHNDTNIASWLEKH